jgi:RNA polymerase sigma-70 factor (subfamily 1)
MPPNEEEARVEGWLAEARTGLAAVEQLIAHYRPFLTNLARQLMSPALNATLGESGVVQEVSVRVWRRVHSFRGRSRGEFEAWLQRITTNVVRDQVDRAEAEQRDWRREEHPQSAGDSGRTTSGVWLDDGSSPSNLLIHEEQWGQFWEALETLPARQRAALTLRLFHRLSDADIGRALGCSANAAQLARARAVARLAAELGGGHDPAPAT